MPFKSKAQQRYLFAKEPSVAEEFAEHTPKQAYKKLPEHVRDKNRLKEISNKYRRKKDG
jgi:ubiquinone/menaquinone biosynthesis C-methylase UbiE